MNLNNGNSNLFYDILIGFGGILGMINLRNAFRKTEPEYMNIIREKDKIIKEQQNQLEKYKKIIDEYRNT